MCLYALHFAKNDKTNGYDFSENENFLEPYFFT